jgi:hypothetical protein
LTAVFGVAATESSRNEEFLRLEWLLLNATAGTQRC